MMDRGIFSVPIVLVLAAVVACGTVAVGVSGLNLMRRMRCKQMLAEDFYKLVEAIQEISHGGERLVLLRSDGKIIIQEKTVEAVWEDEVLMSRRLPLSFRGRVELVRGEYLLRAQAGRLEVVGWTS